MQNSNFTTKDQYIASTLIAFGEKIISTQRVGRECYFIFKNEEGCRKIFNNYFSGEAKIDPRSLFDAFKAIKSIIYNK